MSSSTWRREAAPIIHKVITEHKDSDDKTLRKALREAYPFGERAYHPYKIWCDEVKRQLFIHRRMQKGLKFGEPVGPLFDQPAPRRTDRTSMTHEEIWQRGMAEARGLTGKDQVITTVPTEDLTALVKLGWEFAQYLQDVERDKPGNEDAVRYISVTTARVAARITPALAGHREEPRHGAQTETR